jgi:hypothetical protein
MTVQGIFGFNGIWDGYRLCLSRVSRPELTAACFHAFDLIELNGDDLRHDPLVTYFDLHDQNAHS